MSRTARLLLRFAAIVVLGVVVVIAVVGALLPEVGELRHAASFEPLSKLALPSLPESSKIVTADGQPLGELQGPENREIVRLSEISPEMRKTVLAVEDASFYDHDGVSARSVLRALRANSDAGEIEQGGSTITQQLVKLSLVGTEQSVSRKLREASLALQLEDQLCEGVTKRHCKDRIFEQYLNAVYLGRGVYGVQAAAQLYFGKDASELTWGDAAVLTSLLRNPTGYDPIRYPEVAEERRRIVLGRLVDEGLLTRDEARFIGASPLPTEARDRPRSATTQDLTYLERKIRDELLKAEWLAPTEQLRRYLIFNGGLRITTTIDPRLQGLAEAAAAANPLARANPDTAVALASVEPSTGAVRAIVGEYTTPDGRPIEIASGPGLGRQAGSAFKMFPLVAALEAGYPLSTRVSGSPAPANKKKEWGVPAGQEFPSGCKGGSIDLASATAQSNNCVFMRVQGAVGYDAVRATAEKLGITDTLDPSDDRAACFAIGCGANVYPLDMASAYGTLANDGRRNPPHFVQKVEDPSGDVLFEHAPPDEQVVPVDVARHATTALRRVVTGGTYKGGSLPQARPAAGKTGTMEVGGGANTDVWFVGYTPQLSTAVWIGRPLDATKNLSGGRAQGGSTAALVWRQFMAGALDGAPVVSFQAPSRTPRSKTFTDPWRSSSSRTSTTTRSGSTRSTSPTTTRPTPSTVAEPEEQPAPPTTSSEPAPAGP